MGDGVNVGTRVESTGAAKLASCLPVRVTLTSSVAVALLKIFTAVGVACPTGVLVKVGIGCKTLGVATAAFGLAVPRPKRNQLTSNPAAKRA
jgi:hypothetical protein